MSSILSSASFATFSRNKLIDMCRSNKLSGYSHKSSAQLIDILLKAGIGPNTTVAPVAPVASIAPTAPADGASKKRGRPAKNSSPPILQPTQPTETHKPNHYIFQSNWKDVLPYLESEFHQLILAEPSAESIEDEDWIEESIRVLDSEGIMTIRGLSKIPEAVEKSNTQAQWVDVGAEKFLCISKGTKRNLPTQTLTPTTPTELYSVLVSATNPTATLLLPFGGDVGVVQDILKSGRSCVVVEEHTCLL